MALSIQKGRWREYWECRVRGSHALTGGGWERNPRGCGNMNQSAF